MSFGALATHSETDTRTRIVETAEKFFRHIGYQKTTVADIAKALRMSPANIYRFFESKKAINEAVAERLMRQVEDAIGAIADEPGPAEPRLRRMILTMCSMNAALYTDSVQMHEMVEHALSESWGVVHGHLERKGSIFTRVVREGIESGEFAPGDPTLASHCLQTALIRFFHPALIVQCAGEPGPTVDELTEFALRALRHGGAA